jgi:enoyl-CoA hydratase
MNLSVGSEVSIKKIFTQEEVLEYAKTSGDANPVHFDKEYAKMTPFGKPIVHGLLVASLFGGLLGSKLPGKGTIHLGQTLKFIKPVYVNEEVIAKIEIISIRSDKPIITFDVTCTKEDGEVAITGEAVVVYKGEYFK